MNYFFIWGFEGGMGVELGGLSEELIGSDYFIQSLQVVLFLPRKLNLLSPDQTFRLI